MLCRCGRTRRVQADFHKAHSELTYVTTHAAVRNVKHTENFLKRVTVPRTAKVAGAALRTQGIQDHAEYITLHEPEFYDVRLRGVRPLA